MTKRRLRKLITSLATSLIALLVLYVIPHIAQHIQGTPAPAQPGFYRITTFYDGDTIAVNMNGTEEKVRFIGVDTPETHKPDTPVQCFGPQASEFTKRLIGSQTVRLEADPKDDNRDRYGRLLRYVYLPDNTLVNRKIIEEGYAFAYTSFPFSKKDDFVAAQLAARGAHKGLWANCKVSEKGGRFQTNSVD